ncbi:cadmium-translocating P-type ATPase [Aquirufa ecclesiirivi]|uniref:Cadmium-translocating P-type ATPase n=1 Tax=Aquirufa ecclesiirivi TaxID=2715124 RepID=A0ABT4JEJ8_9BACT|nr:heavy metal translocating P-type ATPase [Aquirufa ecclesiirivi]MCZ2474658.1 cadmium-translocating P-type ATPase [Aquirufa ecclesiirivi]
MKHTYPISGMTCQGCRSHVEKALNSVEGAVATVNLEKAEATIEMEHHISTEIFEKALQASGGNYHIGQSPQPMMAKPKPVAIQGALYYCPMHCEGDKTYDKPGSCPVCGMDLVAQAGSTEDENSTYNKLLFKLKIAIAFTLPIFIISMTDMIPGNPLFQWASMTTWNWVELVLSIPVVFYATWMFFERAWQSLMSRHFNMFTLIGIGAGAAWLFSVIALFFPSIFPHQFHSHHGTVYVYFEAATVILTLVLLGQVLEARAHGKTNAAIRELLKLVPNEATLLRDGKEIIVPIDQIQKLDLIRVKPGEKIPVDGHIQEGHASIDESMISGEPIPVDKQVGDMVRAGSINGNTSFILQTDKVGAETLLAQIIDLVHQASSSKAPIQKMADTISSYFVPAVVLSSLLTFIAWALLADENAYTFAFVNAIAVLIIACPCALGLATPMSVMVGVGKGAQNGILIKNAEALEKLAEVNVVIIDKTGTVTEGKPSLEKMLVSSEEIIEKDVWQKILSLNILSEHPLAKASVVFAKNLGISPVQVNQFEAILGKGVLGQIAGKTYAIGNQKLMEERGINIPVDLFKQVLAEQKQGKTISYFADEKEAQVALVISDKIKESSQQAIQDLQAEGLQVIMLTGDNQETADLVGKKLGLDAWKAQMLPQSKLDEIVRLQAEGKKVAMAGDGINDAPALSQADIGIAMGTGTDVAIESAEITLIKGDLRDIAKARKLSQMVIRNIKENLFFALGYNVLGIPIAAGVLYPFFGTLLSPMLAALAMSFSSVSVISNSLRLRGKVL